MANIAYKILIRGMVQGVGMRPYIYKCAHDCDVAGYVTNRGDGVLVVAQCDEQAKNNFVKYIREHLPPIARIHSIAESVMVENITFNGFEIRESDVLSDRSTQVCPDIAVCDDCLLDRRMQPHRREYPLINCSHCGPRFSIVGALPYDRANTSMRSFIMCDKCQSEYNDVHSRRYHAQPTACLKCGPHYTWHGSDGAICHNYSTIIHEIYTTISSGGIVAIKGVGGYCLVCDAENRQAVIRLRSIKQRESKPFAIMSRSTDVVNHIAELSDVELEALTSWRRPIVVLKSKINIDDVMPGVAPEYTSLGVMLPYMAVHYDMFSILKNARISSLVVTSGNKKGQPIIISDSEALRYFGAFGLSVVSYNREILNAVDDSVVMEIDGKVRVLRRARGYAPEPILSDNYVSGIVAMGADMVSHFAIGKGDQIILSQYLGKLNVDSDSKYLRENYNKYREIYDFKPIIVVHDAHPMYISGSVASELAAEANAHTIAMGHHFAHAVSVMAEYGLYNRALALCLDGTGYGYNHRIWGSELLLCDRSKYIRLSHGGYLPMPGADRAAYEPWRMAVSLVYTLIGDLSMLPSEFKANIPRTSINTIRCMMELRFNSPVSCGAGRLFDAVAALLGICYYNSYDAEAPVLLEQIAEPLCTDVYNYNMSKPLDMYMVLLAILQDIENGVPRSIISARFHNTYAAMWRDEIARRSDETGITDVILTGGVMQNRRLAELLCTLLRESRLNPYLPIMVPCNDAGIAVGQVAHAAEVKRYNN